MGVEGTIAAVGGTGEWPTKAKAQRKRFGDILVHRILAKGRLPTSRGWIGMLPHREDQTWWRCNRLPTAEGEVDEFVNTSVHASVDM